MKKHTTKPKCVHVVFIYYKKKKYIYRWFAVRTGTVCSMCLTRAFYHYVMALLGSQTAQVCKHWRPVLLEPCQADRWSWEWEETLAVDCGDRRWLTASRKNTNRTAVFPIGSNKIVDNRWPLASNRVAFRKWQYNCGFWQKHLPFFLWWQQQLFFGQVSATYILPLMCVMSRCTH